MAGNRKVLSMGITAGSVLLAMVIGDKLNIDENLIKITIGALAGNEILYLQSNLRSKKLNNSGGNNNEHKS